MNSLSPPVRFARAARPPTRPASALVVRSALACLLLSGVVSLRCVREARAATTMPPLLDINAQCEAAHGKNADAMSECVVAESEARAAVLQRWDKVPEATAGACLKLSRKVKRRPYVTLAKCLADDGSGPAPAAAKK